MTGRGTNRSPGRLFAVAVGLALVAVAAERTALVVRARLAEPDGGAKWIWAAGADQRSQPTAFYAVRDFEVDQLGVEGGRTAELTVAADESYIAFVNGRRVGSGAYRRRGAADLYDVTAELEPGWNRLVVEARSGRGAGGLLASLLVDGRPIVVTDSDWRVLRRFEAGLAGGWPLAGGEPPRVWRRHPTGRWRLSPPAARPVEPIGLAPPARARARRFRALWEASPWRDLGAFEGDSYGRLGPWNVFDWGEEVTGHLTLELATTPELPTGWGEAGLLHVGLEVPDPEAPADTLIVPVPGRGLWVDDAPRRFRYAFIAGVELEAAPFVRLVSPATVRDPEGAPARSMGVFGISPPRRLSLVEKEIRNRLLGASEDRAGNKP